MEFKDMKKLSIKDEAFHLPMETICDIIETIFSRETPTPETYRQWNEYAISFYLKLCTCFGIDYQHLEEEDEDETTDMSLKEQEENMECCGTNQPNAKEMSYEEEEEEVIEQGENMERCGMDQPNAKEMSIEEKREEILRTMVFSGCLCWRVMITGPFKFASYSSGTAPDRIPYHLYLLVHEAVDILNKPGNSNDDMIYLEGVEKKIWFFCHYFHSHLPTGWEYKRDNVRSLIADSCDLGRCYTPIGDLVKGEDRESHLSAQDMARVMSIVYSRKQPTFWGMSRSEIIFFCRICACFGIDFQRLEDASEDCVCLMNTGIEPLPRVFSGV